MKIKFGDFEIEIGTDAMFVMFAILAMILLIIAILKA